MRWIVSVFLLVALSKLADGTSGVTATALRGVGSTARALVQSWSRDGCDSASARCVHMYAFSGSPDEISIEYRIPSGGAGEFEPMFEGLRRGQVGSALSGPFRSVDFSALFARASNNSVYVDGSFSFHSEVTAAGLTVFTSRPGHELFMMSAAAGVAACMAPSVPIVLGNGLNDGSTAYAQVSSADFGSTKCLQTANGGSANGDAFVCIQPSDAPYEVEFYRDVNCARRTASATVTLPPAAVDRVRAFATFAVLLGDSHQRRQFISYANPIVTPPMDPPRTTSSMLSRFFSGETFSALVISFAALAVIFIVTTVHSWKQRIDFGDVVLYRISAPPGSSRAALQLGIAVVVLDCSRAVQQRSGGRFMALQPIKPLPADEVQKGGLRVLGSSDGAVSETELTRRLLSPNGSRSFGSAAGDDAEGMNLTLPLAPSAPAAFTVVPSLSPNLAALSGANVPLGLHEEDARPTEPAAPVSASSAEVPSTKDTFVFVEDETKASLPYVRKTFMMTLIDDVYSIIYCVLVRPLLLCAMLARDRGIDSIQPQPVAPSSDSAHNSIVVVAHGDPKRWSEVSLFRRCGQGSVCTDDIVAVLSGAHGGGNYRDADVARVNRRTLLQFLRIKRSEPHQDFRSIEQLMADRRMRGTGCSGGNFRGSSGNSSRDLVDIPSLRRRWSRCRSGRQSHGGVASSDIGREPPYWPRQLNIKQFHSGSLGEDEDECLPFIREVWDQMQEELEFDEEVSEDLSSAEYYIVSMDLSMYAKFLNRHRM